MRIRTWLPGSVGTDEEGARHGITNRASRERRMHICRTAATAVVALIVILSAGTTPASSNGGSRQQHQVLPPAPAPVHGGTIIGTAWRADNTPFPRALIRLRDATIGQALALTRADERGNFQFDEIPAGKYLVEIVSPGEAVLAVGDVFTVTPGQRVSTFVRLTSRAPWFSGFFGNAAAAAIATASTLGITAVGSSGTPVSPQ